MIQWQLISLVSVKKSELLQSQMGPTRNPRRRASTMVKVRRSVEDGKKRDDVNEKRKTEEAKEVESIEIDRPRARALRTGLQNADETAQSPEHRRQGSSATLETTMIGQVDGNGTNRQPKTIETDGTAGVGTFRLIRIEHDEQAERKWKVTTGAILQGPKRAPHQTSGTIEIGGDVSRATPKVEIARRCHNV